MSETETNAVQQMGAGGHVLLLDPSEILLPEETNVRPYSTANMNDKELEELTRLAQSIEEEGQIQPVVVIRNINTGGPEYSLIAGRRRVAAIKMHNLSADEPLKVRAVVSAIKNDKARVQHMYRQAAHENLQRRNINAMDFAANIKNTREKFGSAGKGSKGTLKLAEFFKVSPATITQHEKLLGLPGELQVKVAAGELSNDAALVLMNTKLVPEEQREEVMKAAEKIRANSDKVVGATVRAHDVVEAVEEAALDGVTSTIDGGNEDEEQERKPKSKRKKKASTQVGAKHVRQAVREVTGTNTKRTRTDILEFFSSQLGPTNGHPNGSIHMFCEGLASWADGKIGDKKLTALWDSMVEKSDRGKAEKKEVLEPKKSAVAEHVRKVRAGSAGKAAPKKAAKKTVKRAKKK